MNSVEMTPQVTIVVVPRERFSYTRESLESIYEHESYPFKLIYVDGGSPSHIKNYLANKAIEKQFQLIRTDDYLSPNHARNIGLCQTNSKYVVFIDNDVIVTPDWLKSLVECAEDTGATIVSPLICQGTPLHEEVHCAGGECGVVVESPVRRKQQGFDAESNAQDMTVRRRIIEKISKQGQQVVDMRSQLQRQKTGLAEFHCMIVRTEIFQQIGFLDEALLNTKEHVDLCMLVAEVGGTIYLEPKSLVTYVTGTPLKWTDIHYYMLRWSDAWERASLEHLRKKWNLTEDEYFKNKYKRLGWRRNMTIIYPITRNLFLGKLASRVAGKILRLIDKQLNRYLTTIYANRHLQIKENLTPTQLEKSAIAASSK
ncbi:MAG: glycosyltransferase [Rhizonema sp. PD37]|nr:glycosyltransferase [Rhizonema sp. PD37]